MKPVQVAKITFGAWKTLHYATPTIFFVETCKLCFFIESWEWGFLPQCSKIHIKKSEVLEQSETCNSKKVYTLAN